ncbi:hypothetical protein BGZ58_010444 [Dissophora ornata]|nr:hypothetical protein BGZ58_010444 [Dissophora ornata]
MSRAWSPPLDVRTRTTTTLSVIRARPEHLKAIHEIQLLAYPGRADFHESPEVFQSKLEAYPAGNFIALATTSVLTNDDTLTWSRDLEQGDGEDGEGEGMGDIEIEVQGDDDDDWVQGIHGITVVEITETAPDGSSISTTTTSTTTGDNTTTGETIIRARTPNITEGGDESDDEGEAGYHGASSSTLQPGYQSLGQGRKQQSSRSDRVGADEEEDDDDDGTTTVLFQWEQPVGYLFSHPYSRESMTLHRLGGFGGSAASATLATNPTLGGSQESSTPSQAKKIRLDDSGVEIDETETEESFEDEDEGAFEHDQNMEKYYIHDCAIHPDWRGKGLASKLWKALEESLTPALTDGNVGQQQQTAQNAASSSSSQQGHHHHHHRDRSTGPGYQHKGAPNLKEIMLVSVQGTRPFWQEAGGFEIVNNHDMDLSIYGDEAFLMHRSFPF